MNITAVAAIARPPRRNQRSPARHHGRLRVDAAPTASRAARPRPSRSAGGTGGAGRGPVAVGAMLRTPFSSFLTKLASPRLRHTERPARQGTGPDAVRRPDDAHASRRSGFGVSRDAGIILERQTTKKAPLASREATPSRTKVTQRP